LPPIGNADLGFGPGDANGAHEEAHSHLLLREDMLDARADLRFRVVGVPRRLRHGSALGLLAMYLADEAVLVEEGLFGRGAVGVSAQTAFEVLVGSSRPSRSRAPS